MDWGIFWGITGFIGTVGFSILSIWLVLKLRNRREISYQIIDSRQVLSISPEVKGKSDIPSVEDIYQVVLRLRNSGTEFIRVDEFLSLKEVYKEEGKEEDKAQKKGAIWFSFGNAKVIGSPDVETQPNELKDRIQYTYDPNKESIVLYAFYFNTGDIIKLTVFLTQYDNVCTLNGTIAGVKTILVQERKKLRELIFTSIIQALRYGLYHNSQDKLQEALRKEIELHKE